MKRFLPFFALLLLTLGCEGPTGPKGKDGNANVQVTAGYVDPSSWNLSTTGFYFCEITDDHITQSIVDNGTVLVYYSVNGDDWLLLPYTTVVDANNFYVMDALHFVGKVQVRMRHSNPSTTVVPTTRRYFKIIAITSSSFGKYSDGDIDWNNYIEVKQKFNLQD